MDSLCLSFADCVCHGLSVYFMDNLCLLVYVFLRHFGQNLDKIYVILNTICPWDLSLSASDFPVPWSQVVKISGSLGKHSSQKLLLFYGIFPNRDWPPPPYFRDLWTFSDTFLNSWLKLTEHTTKLLRWWQMHFRRPKETLPYGMIPILPHMATLEIATPMQTATRPSLTTFFCGSPQWIRARFGSNLSPSLICTL